MKTSNRTLPNNGSTPQSMIALASVTALAPMVWGTTYLVSTEFLPADRPLLAGLMRALPAGVGLAAMTRAAPRGAWWIKAAVLGVLNIGGFFALLFYAAFALPGGVAATLGAVQPLVALGLGAVLLGETVRRQSIIAGIAGIGGVGLLVLRADAVLDSFGVAAGLVGAFAMASGVVLTKRWGRPVGLLAFTSWQLIAGGLFLLPLTLVLEGLPPSLTARNWAGFAWLTTVGTALAYSLWFRGVQNLPVAQVSILGLLSPVVAAIAGWLVLDQTMSPGQAIGLVLILGAVWLGQQSVASGPSTTSGRPPAANVPEPSMTDGPHIFSNNSQKMGEMTRIGVSGCLSRMVSKKPWTAGRNARPRIVSPLATLMPSLRLMRSALSPAAMRSE